MADKLKDYQVIDVFCNGTFYKVRHKVTNNIFTWKAYNCSAYSDEQIENVVNEVKTISKVVSDNVLRYYDTILHAPSKTLYFVLEYSSWRSVQELIEECKASDKHIAETFIWRLLHDLARVCKELENLNVVTLRKCITAASIFVGDSGDLRVNCFDLALMGTSDLMRQIGDVIHALCYQPNECGDKIKEFHYSDDLRDVTSFLTDVKGFSLRPDVVLYHPTVLANLESMSGPKYLSDIFVHSEYEHLSSKANKCDSEKAVELCRVVEPLPRTRFNIQDSPIYCNITPKVKSNIGIADTNSDHTLLSPTLAALALELPGFVPRSRKPYSERLDKYNCPQQVSEDTLSEQWMSRLIALRHREQSLNKRERELIAKEIVNSPTTKIIPLNGSQDLLCQSDSNGITLPPMMSQAKDDKRGWMSRRRHRPRSSSVRSKGRRKSYGYEDLDSSLSADAGDSSMVITATKFTKDNLPRRNIFPDVSSKKVHFTSSNPFVESDESVTLTFYDLDNVDKNEYQAIGHDKASRDITKFKYLDLEKLTSEKRAAMDWSHSSPSKQAKVSNNIFSDITNHSIRKTPSKSSLTSKCSSSSRFSMMSMNRQWSMETSSKVSEDSVLERTRSSVRRSLLQTPTAPDMRKSKTRKSLLHFKTPFKFRTSTKI